MKKKFYMCDGYSLAIAFVGEFEDPEDAHVRGHELRDEAAGGFSTGPWLLFDGATKTAEMAMHEAHELGRKEIEEIAEMEAFDAA